MCNKRYSNDQFQKFHLIIKHSTKFNFFNNKTDFFSIPEIIRLDDEDYDYTRKVETTDYYVLKRSDYAEVKCESQNGKQ